MEKLYPWELEKGSAKYPCPKCGQKKLVRYVYFGTNNHVGESFGKCERIESCGFHSIPNKENVTHDFKPVQRPEPIVVFPEDTKLKSLDFSFNSPFHEFYCNTLGITMDHFKLWLVGSEKGNTVFHLRTIDQKTVNAKFIKYDSNGKRTKLNYYLGKNYLKENQIERDPEKLKVWNNFYVFEKCFYGEHLLDFNKDTCIVESEKTAVLASFFFPSFNWLAVGGTSGLKFEKFTILSKSKGRVIYLCDNDEAGIEKSKSINWLRKLAEIHSSIEFKAVNIFKV